MMVNGGYVGMPKGMSIPGYRDGSMVEEMPAYRQEQLAKETEYQKAIEKTARLFSSSSPKASDYMSNIHYFAGNLSGGHQIPKEQVMQDLMKAIEAQRGQEEVMLDPRRLMPEEEVMLDPRRYLPPEMKTGGIVGLENGGMAPRLMIGAKDLKVLEDMGLDPSRMSPVQIKIALEMIERGVVKQTPLPEMMHGGIVGLENGGMMPELFEGEEIVETNPTINAMAAQGGGDLAGKAMPERNVPNERGIISMALETEDEPVEDDEPMIVLAKQEAKARLDEEFRIIKSTAEAEAATGGSPSAVIKSGMDGLARSARRIETETADKYPEVPADANLISSEDLVPYREEFVAMFKAPEIGTEEPMMQDIVMAKNGGKIPGYENGGISYAPGEGPDTIYKRGRIEAGDWGPGKLEYYAPEDISWMAEYDYGKKLLEAVKNKEITVEDAKRLFAMELNPTLEEISKTYDVKGGPGRLEKKRAEDKKIKRSQMNLDQLRAFDEKEAKRDTREEEFLKALIENELGADRHGFLSGNRAKFGSGFLDTIRASADPKKRDVLYQSPEFAKLIKQYMGLKEPLSAVQGQAAQTGDQGQGDPIIKDGLPTTEEMLEQGTVSAGGNTAIPSTISSDSIVAAQEEMKETLRKNLEDLKTSTKKGLEDLSSPIEISMEKYETQATAQDETMEDIFADIERRIPIQARVSGRLSPFTGGGAQASLVRGLRTQEIEQNLFQQNNANKIKFYNLRKQETEARRNKDFEALQNIKLKQLEIIEGIDNTLITETMKLDRDMLAQRIQLEIAQLEVGSKLGAPDYDWSKQLEDVGQGNQSFDKAVENMIAGGNAEYIIKENIVSGQKNIVNPETGKDRNITFREFYETKVALGVPIKEIVEEWSKLPKAKKEKS